MLNTIRQHASSWYIKVIIGSTAIGLGLFYGVDILRSNLNGPLATVATVNGEPITSLKFSRIIENQLNTYEQLYNGNLPPSLTARLRANTLQSLINAELLMQWAKRIKVPVSDLEIAEAIQKNPELQKDGKFDATTYKTIYRPKFLRYFGEDYESTVKDDIRGQKLSTIVFKTLASAGTPTQDLLKRMSETHYSFKRVVFDPKLIALKLSEDEKTSGKGEKKQDVNQVALDLATRALASFNDEAALKKILEPYALKVDEITDQPLSAWRTIVGEEIHPTPDKDTDLLTTAQTLFQLNAEHPLPEKPLSIGGTTVIYKWISQTQKTNDQQTPPPSPIAALYQSALMQSLEERGSIKINLDVTD